MWLSCLRAQQWQFQTRRLGERPGKYRGAPKMSWKPTPDQWRTQKIFRRVHSVAYGGHLHLVCAVYDVTVWRHIHVSKPTFWRSLLTLGIFFCTHSPYFICHWTEYKLSALQVRISEENTLNATTQQFITARISGCVLKQGSKTHSSNLQLQNEAALMSCRIRAVEHRKCAIWLAGAPSGLQDRILLNYTRIKNAHEVRKKFFVMHIKVQQLLVFLFPCWDIIKCLNASVLTTAVVELLQQFYHAK